MLRLGVIRRRIVNELRPVHHCVSRDRAGAISIAAKVDTDLLRAGRQTLNEGVILVCESCGKPIAPSSMMDRIGDLRGDGFADTMSYLSSRCIDCRGLT